MIPNRSIAAFRNFNDVSVNNFGFEVDLYIPNNVYADVEDNDAYSKPGDYEYDHYTAMVFIDWSPNIYRLRNIGMYTEGELPILARFKTTATNDTGVSESVDIVRHSYIKVPTQYVPDKTSVTDEFDIVDVLTFNMHDAALAKQHKLAPRRTLD